VWSAREDPIARAPSNEELSLLFKVIAEPEGLSEEELKKVALRRPTWPVVGSIEPEPLTPKSMAYIVRCRSVLMRKPENYDAWRRKPGRERGS
jgi:hypothetical protein